jgi:predicted acyltransferase
MNWNGRKTVFPMARFVVGSWTEPVEVPTWRPSIPPSSAPPGQRLVSLDALRGFTMFWIVGGVELLMAAIACLSPSLADAIEPHTLHAKWEGFVAWDLIGPMFLFVVGAAIPFALGKHLDDGQPLRPLYGRIGRRVAVLWLLGMIAQGSLLKYDWNSLELYSNTLQAIAIGYLFTSLAVVHLRMRGQIALFLALIVAYWALLVYVPFGGYPAGTFDREANLAFYVDSAILGHFRRDHHFTWILSSLGFIATVLLGAMAGQLLRARLPAGRKLAVLTAIGLACMAGGWLWSYALPINRHVWTSSLVLWAGGWSFLLLALFYAVIDVAGIKRWSFFFVVLGANALLAYVVSEVFGRTMSDVLVTNLANQWSPPYDELLRAVTEVGLLWLLLWYLYRQRTFLRA